MTTKSIPGSFYTLTNLRRARQAHEKTNQFLSRVYLRYTLDVDSDSRAFVASQIKQRFNYRVETNSRGKLWVYVPYSTVSTSMFVPDYGEYIDHSNSYYGYHRAGFYGFRKLNSLTL
jgi:hypothetical protein